jgi:hypothetical protein
MTSGTDAAACSNAEEMPAQVSGRRSVLGRSPRIRRPFAPGTYALGTSPLPTGCTRPSVDPSAWRCPAVARAASVSAGTYGSRRGPTTSRCTAPRAKAYVTPVADDCVGITILTSHKGGFDSHFDEFDALKDRVHGLPHGHDRAAGPLRRRFAAERPGGSCWSMTQQATSTR